MASPARARSIADRCVAHAIGTFGAALTATPLTGRLRRARSSRASAQEEERVDLNTEAVLAIADSAVQMGTPAHLAHAVRLYLYVAHAAIRSGQPDEHGGPAQDSTTLLAALTRLFGACSIAGQLPEHALLLLPYILGAAASDGDDRDRVAARGRRGALNALIHACGRAGAVDAAWEAHAAGVAAAVPVDKYTVTALVAAAGRSRDRGRVFQALAVGQEALHLAVDSDPFVVTALLKACVLAGATDSALAAYDRAIAEGMPTTPAVINALCLVHAASGDLERAASLFGELRATMSEAAATDEAAEPAVAGAAAAGAGVSDISRHRRARDAASRSRDEDTAVSTLLHACVRAGASDRALPTFEAFRDAGYTPSGTSPYAVLLDAVASAALAGGRSLDADERHAATRLLQQTFEDATACGIPADSRLLSALVTAHERVGNSVAAFRAARRAQSLGVRPDGRLLSAVLRACVRSPQAAADELRWVMATAEAHGFGLKPMGDLVLRAHLAACAPSRSPSRPHRGAASRSPSRPRRGAAIAVDAASVADGHLDDALQTYERAREHDWPLTAGTHRTLLGMCAQQDRLTEALELLEHMATLGHEPGLPVLDKLMAASHRVGDIDDDTLALWMQGSAHDGVEHQRGTSTTVGDADTRSRASSRGSFW